MWVGMEKEGEWNEVWDVGSVAKAAAWCRGLLNGGIKPRIKNAAGTHTHTTHTRPSASPPTRAYHQLAGPRLRAPRFVQMTSGSHTDKAHTTAEAHLLRPGALPRPDQAKPFCAVLAELPRGNDRAAPAGPSISECFARTGSVQRPRGFERKVRRSGMELEAQRGGQRP